MKLQWKSQKKKRSRALRLQILAKKKEEKKSLISGARLEHWD